MMKYKIMCVLLIAAMTLGLLGGCSSTVDEMSEQPKQPTNYEQLDGTMLDGTIKDDTVATTTVDLSNTYMTRYGEVNQITAPVFTFSYPAGWEIESEEVSQLSEQVTLSNERGATIVFINIHGSIGAGSAIVYSQIEVSKIADSIFIPGYVQATDYSDLGEFMVAQLKTIGTMNTTTDTDFVSVKDGSISYAVLPESMAGVHAINKPYFLDLAFEYAGNTIFVASAPDGQFTPQEEAEVISILSSFRNG